MTYHTFLHIFFKVHNFILFLRSEKNKNQNEMHNKNNIKQLHMMLQIIKPDYVILCATSILYLINSLSYLKKEWEER